MDILQALLVVLVSLWVLIFIIIVAILLMVFLFLRKSIKGANKIIDETEDIAQRLKLPSKIVLASIFMILLKRIGVIIRHLIIGRIIRSKRHKTN